MKLLKIVKSTYTIEYPLKKLSGRTPAMHADYAMGFDKFGSKGIHYTGNWLIDGARKSLLKAIVKLSLLLGIGIALFWKQSHTTYLIAINKRRSAWSDYLLKHPEHIG